MAKPENVRCPECDGPMVSRTSAHGVFWGCKDYPRCKGTRNSMGEARKPFARPSDASEPDSVLPSERWGNRDRRRWED
jgi:ssDNA-binding Zn-finger/Zn-ribbon topoisomerase 1